MTKPLIVCLILSALLIAATIALLATRVMPVELDLWRFLRIRSLRRWITKRRGVHEPLEEERTVQIARKNIVWHLVLTVVFFTQIASALVSEGSWWRPLAVILVIPCLAYFVGSLVQRQKIAIIETRKLSSHAYRIDHGSFLSTTSSMPPAKIGEADASRKNPMLKVR